MGFQKFDRFIRPSFTHHETHYVDDPSTPVDNHLASSSSGQEYTREGSGSPQPATDDSSTATASPVPSAGDSGPENTSDKSCSHDQEPLNLKAQSLRQRTAQACDKCRERKTKCSGHRPVCSRCTNRGLICEYTIRESRARSIMRHRTIPSPNPFQINYQSGGGRPTPAYHSRMGRSQTNAYARPSNDHLMSLDHSMSPSLPSLLPSASSSTDQLRPRHNDLDIHYSRHSAHIKEHPDMRRDSKGWGLDPLARSQASYLERQRAVHDSAYGSGTLSTLQKKDSTFSSGYMGRNLTTNSAPNDSMHDMQLDQRTLLHGMPVILPDAAYRQYSTDGTIISFEDGPGLSSGSTSSSRRPGLSTERETYDYSEGAASVGLHVGGYTSANGYTEWDKLGHPLPHSHDASIFSTEYDAAIAHYNSSYSSDDRSTMVNAMGTNPLGQSSSRSNMSSQNDLMYLASSLPISTDACSPHVAQRSAYAPQDGFQKSIFYNALAHDTPENTHPYSVPLISDPGNRYEGFKFFK